MEWFPGADKVLGSPEFFKSDLVVSVTIKETLRVCVVRRSKLI